MLFSIERLLSVRAEEQKRFFQLFFLYMCVVGATVTTTRTVAFTLFLKNLDARYLPYMYITLAVFESFNTLVYANAASRVRLDRLIVVSFSLFLLATAGFWVIFEIHEANFWVLAALYVFAEVAVTISVLQFWTFAGEMFTSRQGRRLYAMVGAGGACGQVLFGAIMGATVTTLGIQNFLLVASGLFVICILLVSSLRQAYVQGLDDSNDPTKRERRSSSHIQQQRSGHNIHSRRLGIAIAAMIGFTTAAVAIVDYQWKISAANTFEGQADHLARYFSLLLIVMGLLEIFLQFFVTSRLVSRLGIQASLTIEPLYLIGCSLTILLAAPHRIVLWAATLQRMENTLRFAITSMCKQMLYQPIGEAMRRRIKAIVDGIVNPLAVGCSGVALLLIEGKIPARDLSYATIGLAAAWTLAALVSHRRYVKTLEARLSVMPSDEERERPILGDAAALNVYEEILKGEDEYAAAAALEFIDEVAPGPRRDALVLHLLKKKSTWLRRKALVYLGRTGDPRFAPTVRLSLEDEEPSVRAAAISAYCEINQSSDSDMAFVHDYQFDPNPEVKGAAIASLIRCGGLDGILAAAEELKRMFRDSDPLVRKSAAEVLGRLKVRHFHGSLRILLEDEDRDVVLEAIRASRQMRSHHLIAPLVTNLDRSHVSRSAADALAEYDAEVITPLGHFLDQSEEFPKRRLALPRIIGTIGARSAPELAAEILMKHFDDADDLVRASVYAGLEKIVHAHPDFELDHDRIETRCQQQLRCYFQQTTIVLELRELLEESLLQDSLLEERARITSRILTLIGILYPQLDLASIRHSLGGINPKDREYALELLDNTIGKAERTALLGILDPVSDEKKVAIGKQLYALEHHDAETWLRILMQHENAWVRATACLQVGRKHLSELRDDVERLRHDDDELVRSAADFTLVMLTCLTESSPSWLEVAQLFVGEHCSPTSPLTEERMLSTIEKVILLKANEVFRELDGKLLVYIAEIALEGSYPAGTVILREGESREELYLITSGSVVLTMSDREISVRGKGDIFGLSILRIETTQHSAIAQTDVSYLKINRDDFIDLIQERSEVALGLIRLLTSALAKAQRTIADREDELDPQDPDRNSMWATTRQKLS
ncbi:Cyclic nucleotide-binding domain protein [Planctomycetes bacterium Pan216]|uniref:ADP,ATP carrier protein n=1 Tax=Kolteria novifilia TaxID=2527975 RepID=A0A518B7W6_9BACT|nr:Cyclic nucleotide-binding domain protein [Planctomycetes bacterium Pan216]